jgi:hypothetical protein
MSRKNRFIIAAALGLGLIFAATGVWAAPTFQGVVDPLPGSVPAIPFIAQLIPVTGGENCPEAFEAHAGTAIFTGCIILVELIPEYAETFVGAPEGKVFYGDAFTVTALSAYPIIEACYPYPPDYAKKGANIYKLDIEASPNKWVEILEPDVLSREGMICVTSLAGIFALIGNP